MSIMLRPSTDGGSVGVMYLGWGTGMENKGWSTVSGVLGIEALFITESYFEIVKICLLGKKCLTEHS